LQAVSHRIRTGQTLDVVARHNIAHVGCSVKHVAEIAESAGSSSCIAGATEWSDCRARSASCPRKEESNNTSQAGGRRSAGDTGTGTDGGIVGIILIKA